MKYLFSIAILTTFLNSCNSGTTTPVASADSTVVPKDSTMIVSIKEETVSIPADTTHLECFVAYDESKTGPRPIVLILPEWWGLNEYPKMRARKLAELGYFAVAVDIFGNGKVGANPDEAKSLTGPFYGNPKLSSARIMAALAKAKTYSHADSTKTAAIGYCFGGTMVLNAARLGSPFTGVVSFHGGLAGVTPAKNTIKSKILICHGAADSFISPKEVAEFKKQLDSVSATYTFKEYPNATHAYSNPASDENAKKFKMPIAYNAEADKNSWNDMKDFFGTIFK